MSLLWIKTVKLLRCGWTLWPASLRPCLLTWSMKVALMSSEIMAYWTMASFLPAFLFLCFQLSIWFQVVVLFIVVVVVAMQQPGSERTVISCMLYVKHICIYDNKVDFWLWLLTFDFTFVAGWLVARFVCKYLQVCSGVFKEAMFAVFWIDVYFNNGTLRFHFLRVKWWGDHECCRKVQLLYRIATTAKWKTTLLWKLWLHFI